MPTSMNTAAEIIFNRFFDIFFSIKEPQRTPISDVQKRARLAPINTDILEFVLAYSEIHEPRKHLSVATDPKDNKFVDCALHARAKFLITGDKGLLSIKQFRNIRIMTPEDFLKL